jgi:hypothetical protein
MRELDREIEPKREASRRQCSMRARRLAAILFFTMCETTSSGLVTHHVAEVRRLEHVPRRARARGRRSSQPSA